MNIFLGAHFNLNNGDRALLEATIENLQKYYPQCHITVSAYRPNLLNDHRFHTVGWPLRNGKIESFFLSLTDYSFFRKMYKKIYGLISGRRYLTALKSADIVFMSGGHHLTDFLANRAYYKLASNFMVPIYQEKKIILLPQSIGPAEDTEIKRSIEYIISRSSLVACRDQSSIDFIDSLCGNYKTYYVPDLVYSILPAVKRQTKKCVGIALYHSYGKAKRETILPFTISNLTRVIDELIKREYKVKIIPMDNGDEEFSEDIYNHLSAKNKSEMFVVVQRNIDILDTINEFSGLSFVLAYKTHSTVFSMICNTPLVAIAYHPKTIDFMASIGLEKYAINDIDASYENIINLIDEVERNSDYIKKIESDGVGKIRNKIDLFFKEKVL